MKRIVFVLCSILMMVACTNKKAINSKDLQGRYEIDLSSAFSGIDDEDYITMAFAAMVLSQIQLTAQFDGNMLIVDASTATKTLINTFTEGDDLQLPLYAEYKIKNDSILYLKIDKEFEERGVLRRICDSYDYLQFVTALSADDPEPTTLNLKRLPQ